MQDCLIYLIRHGESVGNARREFLGHTDLPITDKGRAQARAAARFLAKQGFVPDAVYASPLCRAAETTDIALSQISAPLPVYLDGLREIYAGDWEGRHFDELDDAYPEERRLWKEDIGHAQPVGGESVAHLYERVVACVKQIAKENLGKTVFIGTHATPIRSLEAYARGYGVDRMKELPWPTNASLSVYRSDGEKIECVSYSLDTFQDSTIAADHTLKY